ncbi:glycosyltransferase family 2 protein [Aminivibrio sp.]|uniref:glycosyltransferase family 2 protein n=1 Tax=Aminivibrio sp. TaxID=1872489 RepID=UPI00345E346C
MIALSVYFVTLNEERRLPLALEKASLVADEIVVVDSGSIDGTEAVARRFGAKFIVHPWESIGHQVSFAEKCCSNRWVLRLDADEVLSDELVEEIRRIKELPGCSGYRLRIGNVFPGIEVPLRWVKHYRLIRLYNRDAMEMSGRFGHDDVVFKTKNPQVKTLHGFVCHYSYLGLNHLFEKRLFESDMQRRRAKNEQKRYSPWRMVGAMSLNFLKVFFLDRYFLYGFWGFILAISVGHLRFLKFAKIFEYERLEKDSYLGLEEKQVAPGSCFSTSDEEPNKVPLDL